MLRPQPEMNGSARFRASVWAIGILLVVAALLPACSKRVGAVNPAYADRVRQFGFRLFAEMAKDSTARNIVLSPVGVEMCLAMAMNGAGGTTRTEIAQALGVPEAEMDSLNQANAALLGALSSSGRKVRLSVANSVWGRKDVAFSKDFREKCQRSYGANVRSVDFISQSAVREINRWASEKTGGLFPELLGSTDPNDVLMAFSATYFAGKWAMPFSPKYTQPGRFHLRDGSTVERQMMYTEDDFAGLDTDDFSAVALPFANRRFCMYVFVPAESSSLPRFLSSLNDANWSAWTSALHPSSNMVVVLPRFTIESKDELETYLRRMHVVNAFDPARADFSAMTAGRPTTPIWLKNVVHCAIVEVNEAGARATSIAGYGVVAGVPDEVIADRPFFFAITDIQTNVILFMGAVYDPPQ
jgi:serine protease inhibitor